MINTTIRTAFRLLLTKPWTNPDFVSLHSTCEKYSTSECKQFLFRQRRTKFNYPPGSHVHLWLEPSIWPITKRTLLLYYNVIGSRSLPVECTQNRWYLWFSVIRMMADLLKSSSKLVDVELENRSQPNSPVGFKFHETLFFCWNFYNIIRVFRFASNIENSN